MVCISFELSSTVSLLEDTSEDSSSELFVVFELFSIVSFETFEVSLSAEIAYVFTLKNKIKKLKIRKIRNYLKELYMN